MLNKGKHYFYFPWLYLITILQKECPSQTGKIPEHHSRAGLVFSVYHLVLKVEVLEILHKTPSWLDFKPYF